MNNRTVLFFVCFSIPDCTGLDATELLSADFFEPDTLHKIGVTEYVCVRPVKLHKKSLHTDDLLYESKNNGSGHNHSATLHFTGEYRKRDSRLWDPHPQYTLEAFGMNMRLDLYNDGSFIHTDLKVCLSVLTLISAMRRCNNSVPLFPVGDTRLAQRDASPEVRSRWSRSTSSLLLPWKCLRRLAQYCVCLAMQWNGEFSHKGWSQSFAQTWSRALWLASSLYAYWSDKANQRNNESI